MQLFGLSADPRDAASELCNQHILSQTKEATQILFTLLWRWGVVPDGPVDCADAGLRSVYTKTHEEHPCTLWAAACQAHAMWTYQHAKALAEEYTRRAGGTRKHLCSYHIEHWHAHVRERGWPKGMPERVEATDWLESMDTTKRPAMARRVATTNAPLGCGFGICGFDLDDPHLGAYDAYRDDWVGSYRAYYDNKRDTLFKKPMQWGLFKKALKMSQKTSKRDREATEESNEENETPLKYHKRPAQPTAH